MKIILDVYEPMIYSGTGDSIVDMKAGNNARVKTIGITTGVNTKEQLQKYKPYAIINKLAELPSVLT